MIDRLQLNDMLSSLAFESGAAYPDDDELNELTHTVADTIDGWARRNVEPIPEDIQEAAISPLLTSTAVKSLFVSCLGEIGDVEIEGIVHTSFLRRDMLDEHKSEIIALLDELPQEFQSTARGGGGGWSFLQACMDKHGNQWTGMHLIMEQLFTLGMGIEKVKCPLPRQMWDVLPGGVPYYEVV